MKRAILFLACLFAINLHADEEVYEEPICREINQAFNYWNYGFGPVPLTPYIGVGRREMNNHFGWDASINLGSIIYITTVQATANVLYIPNPEENDPFYFGLGIAGGYAFYSHFAISAIAPDFLIGKEYTWLENRKTFMECHLQIPTWHFGYINKKGKGVLSIPLFVIKTGISF
jgi:hypothetical protein